MDEIGLPEDDQRCAVSPSAASACAPLVLRALVQHQQQYRAAGLLWVYLSQLHVIMVSGK